ncbi:MAG: hypothetical protein H7336_03460 [Bacteriovorax sp.]|nr:hypothetical protein [Bacteriovorax sp.]
MKKLILSAITALTVSGTAAAFVPQMQFFVNREVAIARVFNTTFQPVACSGVAFGRTFQGVVLNAYANHVVIYPGASVDVYVNSNFYDPMVQAWAQIDCQVAWF